MRNGGLMEQMIIDEMNEQGDSEFIVSLSATVETLEQANSVFDKLSATALDISHETVSVMVSKNVYDDSEDDENFGVDAVFTTMMILKEHGLEAARAWDIIDELHKAGISLRERR